MIFVLIFLRAAPERWGNLGGGGWRNDLTALSGVSSNLASTGFTELEAGVVPDFSWERSVKGSFNLARECGFCWLRFRSTHSRSHALLVSEIGAGGFQCGFARRALLCLEFAEPRVQLRVAAIDGDDLGVLVADFWIRGRESGWHVGQPECLPL